MPANKQERARNHRERIEVAQRIASGGGSATLLFLVLTFNF